MTLIGILVNAFLLYFYLGNNYLLSRKIYYAVIFVFLMILVWVFGKAINGIGVMLTTQGKMLRQLPSRTNGLHLRPLTPIDIAI